MKSLEQKIREAVEKVLNDRKGMHWDELDSSTLDDLRAHVEREIGRVLREAGQ